MLAGDPLAGDGKCHSQSGGRWAIPSQDDLALWPAVLLLARRQVPTSSDPVTLDVWRAARALAPRLGCSGAVRVQRHELQLAWLPGRRCADQVGMLICNCLEGLGQRWVSALGELQLLEGWGQRELDSICLEGLAGLPLVRRG